MKTGELTPIERIQVLESYVSALIHELEDIRAILLYMSQKDSYLNDINRNQTKQEP